MSNFNSRRNSQFLLIWNYLLKEAKTSEKSKLFFLKGLTPVLRTYASTIKSILLENDFQKLIPLFNTQGLHFLTLETLNSVFLNHICQINISLLYEEHEILRSGLEFFYESFGIIKDESLKNKVISFVMFILEKKEFLLKIFEDAKAIQSIIFRGFLEENHIIFLSFLNYFTENILKNEEINNNFRINFFKEVKSFLQAISDKSSLNLSYQNRIGRFFCVFFQKLVIGEEVINCLETFQSLKNTSFCEDLASSRVFINLLNKYHNLLNKYNYYS